MGGWGRFFRCHSSRFLALVGCALVLATAVAPVRAAGLLHNGDFEGSVDGWAPSAGATLSLEGGAARVTSVSEAFWQIRSAWIEAEPGAEYELSGSVRGDPAFVDSVTAILEFSRADGSVDHRPTDTVASLDTTSFASVSGATTAPAGAAWMRAVFEGASFGTGGWFDVDGVELVMVEPPPEVVPTVQPSPSPSPTPTSGPGGTATPTPTGTVTPTPTPTVSPTPTPTATAPVLLPIARSLWNPSFEDGTTAWSASRGESLSVSGLSGTRGGALLLRASGTSTAWVEQPVIVDPGGWYVAEASLSPLDGVRAAWVRIAWYASTDASGPQMQTDDSETVAGVGRASTGPVQAPPDAHSAKVRVLLQPNEPGARLGIDDVVFAPTDPPPPEVSPTPTATATAAPTPLTPSSPSSVPTAEPTRSSEASPTISASPPAPFVGTSSAPVSGGAVPTAGGNLGDQSVLRITELLPDAIQPGRDADFEWVELTNLGDASVDLAGMVVRDEQDAVALPSFVVPPGASVVVAGALAEVDADIRLDRAIGNGLGNEGDRLELVDATGSVVDVFEYGPGTELEASPGESLHRWFDAEGSMVGAMAGVPSPGVYQEASPSEVESTAEAMPPNKEPEDEEKDEASAGPRDDGGGDPLAWMLAIALAGGGVGGALVQRLGPSRGR